MAARPADGRSVGVRVHARPRPPAATRPTGRAPARPGPLVARRELTGPVSETPDRPARARPQRSRVRRFARRWGWRAYAVPLLTLATLLTLGDLALNGRPEQAGTPVAARTSAPPVAPEPSATAEAVPTDAVAEVDAAPTGTPAPTGPQPYVERGVGTVTVVDVTSQVYGSGPLRRFAVEIEDGIDMDGAAFSEAVQATLADPRSWGSGGRYSFQQVGAAQVAAKQYDFKVTLISPANMDAYCPGLQTNGYTSCRVGERAVINLARWATAVPHYDGDITAYRHYVVNHEVGHALGNGHEPCPGPGAVAPVMLQQTLGLDGCVKNAWPYP